MLGKRIINTGADSGAACTTDTVQILGDTSCVAYYKMSDATDETGSYDGTPSNVNFNVAGKFGNAGEFNGSSSYIDTTYTVPAVSTQSISVWFKTTSTGSYRTIFSDAPSNGAAVNTRMQIYTTPTSTYDVIIGNNSGYWIGTGNSISSYIDGNWHNLIATYNGTDVKIYIDGSLFQSFTSTIPFGTAGNQSLVLGKAGLNNVNYWNGSIDQVRIFDRAITANEVTTLYNEVYCQPTIVPTDHFEPVIYTGTGSSQSITTLDFAPDFTWIKSRSNSTSHVLSDSVRGANLKLRSNSTAAEAGTDYGVVTSFDNNGFTVGGTIDTGDVNFLNWTYVAWNWKAGGAAVSNTDGTITSQVSANVDAGFSIVKYSSGSSATGTVGHGLSQPPQIVIQKSLGVDNWFIANNLVNGGTNYEYLLFTTGAQSTSWTFWDGANAPNSSTFKNGWDGNREMINYCFHSVDGMSRIGSYVGTGAAGNSIVTGFRPAFVMVKSSSNANYWYVLDNKRNTSNPINSGLFPNDSLAEITSSNYNVDFNSNGFTLQNNTIGFNQSGYDYIFMAFAEENVQPQPELANSFNTVTYTGNGGTQAINTVGFQPDLVWIKDRTSANSHILQDSVRGANKALLSNATSAEITSTDFFTSFDSNGFTLPSNTGEQTNKLNNNYVAWCWKASNESTINQEGSISSIVSANPAAGFSVVKYTTPATNNFSIGHGLSSTPELVFFKGINQADNWITYASTTGATKYLRLNGTDAATTSSLPFNDTSPTSTVINLGSATTFWGTSIDTIAYCFHSVDGYQKVGSYTGTTAAKQVDVGFQPRFVMIKNSSRAGEHWFIADSARTGDPSPVLRPNISNAEQINSSTDIDFYTSGFSLDNAATASAGLNENGDTYIYLAIA